MTENSVKPYDHAGEKKAQVTAMFNKIAGKYDLLNRMLSLGIDTIWRKRAVKYLERSNPDRILDIATGTGDVAIEVYSQYKPSTIVGLDISDNMINLAEKKITRKGLSATISMEVGDCENLRFSTGSFDATTVAFGVRNFGDLKKGLSEMHRILRDGGQIVVLEFSKPLYFPFKQIFNLYFRHLLPFIGKMTSKDKRAYKYLYESVQAFPDYDNFAEILREVGFRSVEYKPLSLGICTIYSGIK